MIKNIPPIVGVDIDGVLCDFNTHFVALMNEHLGTCHSVDEVTEHEYSECLPLSKKQISSVWNHRVTPDWWLGLPILEGALESIDRLSKVARVWLITARGPAHYDATYRWLKKHGFTHHTLISAKNKMEFSPLLATMVEDKWSTAQEFADSHTPVVLMDAAHNRKGYYPNLHRVANWAEAIEVIERLIPNETARHIEESLGGP